MTNDAAAGAIQQPLPTSANGGAVGPGLGAVGIVNADLAGVNNDNKNVKGNSFVSMDLMFAAVDVIDLVFEVRNTGGFVPMANAKEDAVRNPCNKDPCGTTEYRYEADVINNTNQAWAGLGFKLGFGTGNNFQLSNGRDFLDFDTPDKDPKPDRNGNQNGFQHQENTIDWTGAVRGLLAGTFFLNFDVPDFNSEMPQNARIFEPDGVTVKGYRFTLRVTPVAAQQAAPPAVIEVKGKASRVGVPVPLGREGGAQVSLAGKFSFTGFVDLTGSPVIVTDLLNEISGVGEMVTGTGGAGLLPVTLQPRPGSRPDAAIYESPPGTRPAIRLEIKRRHPDTPLFEFSLRVDRATIAIPPTLCTGQPPTTGLVSRFVLDANRAVDVAIGTAWRCLPGELRVP